MNEIDISKLTNEAEKGHGCIIRDAVANVPFEESFQIMKQIAERNRTTQEADQLAHRVSFGHSNEGMHPNYGHFFSKAYISNNTLQLTIDPTSQWSRLNGKELVRDSLDLDKMERKITCKDL